jgi:hypothetical protein
MFLKKRKAKSANQKQDSDVCQVERGKSKRRQLSRYKKERYKAGFDNLQSLMWSKKTQIPAMFSKKKKQKKKQNKKSKAGF